MQKLTPLADWVLINPEEEPKGGIILDVKTSAKLNPLMRGVVVQAGKGTKENPMSEFKYGQKEQVRFPKGAGIEVKLDERQCLSETGKTHHLVNYDDLVWLT